MVTAKWSLVQHMFKLDIDITHQVSSLNLLTLSSVKHVLSNDFMEMGNVVISVKLVVLTADGPPGLGTANKLRKKSIQYRNGQVTICVQ